MRTHSTITARPESQQTSSHLSMGQLLAITVPVAAVICSVAWSISVYLIVRESKRARIEIARLESTSRS